MKMHRESFLQIPLVSVMMNDRSVRFSERALDSEWSYTKTSPVSLSGFSASTGRIFHNSESQFSRWLKNPSGSARVVNRGDHLAKEVLFAVHDYLHIWAYQAINELLPKLKFGRTQVTVKNFESFVFCHLLSESVATIGLDYWYLSQIDLNDVVPIGTQAFPHAAKYTKGHEKELGRLGLKMRVFDVSFFSVLTKFYMTGEFLGFSVRDLNRSPVLMNWLTHELLYGETQRAYTRAWLNYLSGDSCRAQARAFKGKVESSERWQKELVEKIGQLLWQKVVLREDICFDRSTLGDEWTQSAAHDSKLIDFRFFNINSIGEDVWPDLYRTGVKATSSDYLFWQILSKYRMKDFTQEQLALLKKCDTTRELNLMEYLLGHLEPLKSVREPSALFLPN